MKIKCPYLRECELYYSEFSTAEELGEHFEKYHPKGTPYNFADKIFKIHEKIEVFDQALDHHYTNDDVIQELKSLLENKE